MTLTDRHRVFLEIVLRLSKGRDGAPWPEVAAEFGDGASEIFRELLVAQYFVTGREQDLVRLSPKGEMAVRP